MVDVLGHLALSLLLAIPAWFVLDERAGAAFVGLALLTAMVPDIDLYLPWVAHHGITHTVSFAAFVALVGGVALPTTATVLERDVPWSESAAMSPTSLYAFGVAGLFVGGLGHVLVDTLSSSMSGAPVAPLWPLVDRPFSVHVIESYSAPVWNGLPFLVAVGAHAFVYSRTAATARVRRG